MDKGNIRRGRSLVYIVSIAIALVFYTWLSYQIPYTHDDWEWGISTGIEHITTADINSRYAGNLLEVLVTRSEIAKTLIMGIVFTAIVFTASLSALLFNGKPVEEKKFLGVFLAGNALFLCIPMIIWNQTNGWIAGFSNFVVSALALLGYFMIVFRDRKDYKPGIAAGAGCLVFGLAMQLFIENLTVFFAAFSLCLVIYTFKRYGKSAVDIYMLFLGNLIGAVIMFNNNIYSSLWNTGYAIDGYRHMVYDRSQSFGVFLSDALYRYLVEFIPGTISFDVLLEAFIAILCLLIVLKKMKAKSKDLTPVVAKVFIALDALYAVYYVHIKMLGFPAFVNRVPNLYAILDLLFVVVISFELLVLFKEEKKMLARVSAAWFSSFFIMVPMLSINTVGYRSYYTGIVSHILAALILMVYYLNTVGPKQVTVWITAMAIFTLLFAGAIVRSYIGIGQVNRERLRLMRDAAPGTEITLPEYPYSDHLWYPDPNTPDRVPVFREFYSVPDDVEIVFPNADKA